MTNERGRSAISDSNRYFSLRYHCIRAIFGDQPTSSTRVKRPKCVIKLNLFCLRVLSVTDINPLTPNDDYSGRTAPLTSKRCILYIYSTNIGTEYFKYGIYSPFFPLQNAVCFINLTYLVYVLFTFYIQSVLKLKK